jgi:hypothetical protein
MFRRAGDRAEDLPAAKATSQSAVIDGFLANLTVEPLKNSQLVDVKFRSTDPALARSPTSSRNVTSGSLE